MEVNRKPYQGVLNIIRFNWHFYLIAVLLYIVWLSIRVLLSETWLSVLDPIALLGLISMATSLLASYYVYDQTDLYQMSWLPDLNQHNLLNINAGFDETSSIIKEKFPESTFQICDFYNPQTHTEVSIKRARKAYPPDPNTQRVQTTALPFKDDHFDTVIAIFSVHEIRDENERLSFLKELHRITKKEGKLLIMEHLRDLPNFLAYTLGFMHFYSKSNWLKQFRLAQWTLQEEQKHTPFVSVFKLKKHGDSP